MRNTKPKPPRIIPPSELFSKTETLYDTGLQRGYNTGWQHLDKLISIKEGTTFYVYGSPYSGKTEFWFEMLINLSCIYGLRHAIFSPETGQGENILSELASKYVRKPFFKTNHNHITRDELYAAMNWVNHHFLIIEDHDGGMDANQFYELVNDEELQTGRIHTTLIDPFNELSLSLGEPRDIGLEKLLGFIRRNAQITNRVNCIITHVMDQELRYDEKTKEPYYPRPTPRQIAYGQAWYRKGMNMLGVWRPPAGVQSPDGRIYEPNEVHIYVDKVKPKGVGERGMYKLFYDKNTNSYYDHSGMQHQYSIRDPKQYNLETSVFNNVMNDPDNLPF